MEVIFTCKIRDGINVHWVIDGEALAFEDSVREAESEGYIIGRHTMTDVTSLTLTFNVTMDKNGTKIHCSSLDISSTIAVLLTLSGN